MGQSPSLCYMTKILRLGSSICFRTQPSELSTAPVDGSLGRFSSSQLTWSALLGIKDKRGKMSEKKVKLRMGIHDKVTIDRWQAMKDDLKAGLPIEKIARRNSVSESTVRRVRRSKTYREYRLSHDRSLKEPVVVVAKSCNVPYEDFGRKPLFFSPKKVKPTNLELSNRLDREVEKTARCLGVVLAGIVGIVVVSFIVALAMVVIKALAGGVE